jgi:hypothetical protein
LCRTENISEIAAELNAEKIRTTRGLRWNGETIGKVLANEAYTGSLIFNRCSYKLKQKRVDNPRDMWIRYDNAFPPVPVSRAIPGPLHRHLPEFKFSVRTGLQTCPKRLGRTASPGTDRSAVACLQDYKA